MPDPRYVCHVLAQRERLHWSQIELARRAGLTRQAVNMIERGLSVPSVTTAMKLSEVLGCPVTKLFQHNEPVARSLQVCLPVGVDFREKRVRLAEVAGRWVAVPVLTGDMAEFGEADGHLVSQEGDAGRVRLLTERESLRNNLLIAGCDPAIALLRDLWRRDHCDEGALYWQNLSSSAAVDALRQGSVHIAGVHFHDPEALRAALASLPMEVVVIRFARWEQGWMLPRGNPRGFRTVEDLCQQDVSLVNRAEGSGSRLLLDSLLKTASVSPVAIRDYGRIASTHFACARSIRDGAGNVAIGLRAVAEAYGLDFRPIQEVGFNFLVPRQLLDFAPVARLLDLLQDLKLQRQLGDLPGYEVSDTGSVVALN